MVERKTKLIIFWSIIILIGVIVLIKTDIIETGRPFAFYGYTDSGADIKPDKTAYVEGDELTLKVGDPNSFAGAWWSACSLKGYAIWIDGKKYAKQTYIRELEGSVSAVLVTDGITYMMPHRYTRYPKFFPSSLPTGDFGSVELEIGLSAGSYLVEGWYAVLCYRHYPDLPRYYGTPANFFRFKINVAPPKCILDAGQYLHQATFGPGAIYDKNDLKDFIKLCSINPTTVIDKRTLTIDQDYTIKTKLENNQKITVSSNKIYIQYWVGKNPLAECEEGLVYNSNANKCLAPGTIVWCSQGQWIDGACVTTIITQCERDEDCISPCPGMSAKCGVKDEFTKVCQYSGECEVLERIVVVKENIYIEKSFSEYISDWIANIFDKILGFFGVG